MKKLALAFATLALLATPVLACPHSDGAKKEEAQTAEKAKDTKDAKGQDKAKEQPKKEADKTAKPTAKPKTDDKVSKR